MLILSVQFHHISPFLSYKVGAVFHALLFCEFTKICFPHAQTLHSNVKFKFGDFLVLVFSN
jgi:hypothetical protein